MIKNTDAKCDTTYNIDRKVFRMSKWDKLLTRICALTKDLRFDELMVKQIVESETVNDENAE